MEAYIRAPPGYRLPVHLQEKGIVSQAGDYWRVKSCSSSKGHRRSPPPAGDAMEGTQRIRLFVAHGAQSPSTGATVPHSFDVAPSANLKALFNDYAKKRGISLRSLRFSYHGKPLFLSSVGNKSPNELNLRDRDTIVAHDVCASDDTSASPPFKPKEKVSKNENLPPKRAKGKRKKGQKHREEPATSLEEHRARHSARLSKVHEEAEQRLREIRTRLNSIGLQRQPPKRRRGKEKKTARASEDSHGLQTQDVGSQEVEGKAGRSHFLVRVGEEQNLYRTEKPSSGRGPCGLSGVASTLDLHGHTREEALAKLDGTLKVWVDAAMRGSHPFVISAKIVCGCGNQAIAETVEGWMKTRRNIGNAPSQIQH